MTAVVSLSLSLSASVLALDEGIRDSFVLHEFQAAAINATFLPTRLATVVRPAGALVLFFRSSTSKLRLPERVLGAAPSLYATLCRLFVEAPVN